MTPRRLAYAAITAAACLMGLLACSQTTPAPAPQASPTFSAGQIEDATQGAADRATRAARATQAVFATATAAAQQKQAAENAQGTAYTASLTAGVAQITATNITLRATVTAVVPQAAGWPVRLKETFQDNRLGWPITVVKDDTMSIEPFLKDGAYVWTTMVFSDYSFLNLMPDLGPIFKDFKASVTVSFGQGSQGNESAYGLAVRHNNRDYVFLGATAAGGYRALEVHGAAVYSERDGKARVKPGDPIRLSIVGYGDAFVFTVGDQVVTQFAGEFDPGKIGLGIDAQAKAPAAQVSFADLDVQAP